ncbi:MAG: hypothetical protein EAZ24_12270 [Burkholderiales bacterium]|nr:MAG: hypothetical protein EAZ24_12270 [Burkholderiales bacterium]
MTTTTWITALIAGLVAFAVSGIVRAQRKRKAQRSFIQAYVFPDTLRRKVHQRHPHLAERALDDVFAALREWFLLLQRHPREKFGMPSRVVDDAWHEFILMTRLYQRFCEQGFGNYVHHEPNQANAEQNSAALGRTLERSGGRAALQSVGALGVASGVAVAGAVLFAIDGKLGVENGFTYSPDALDAIERDYRASVASSSGGGGCSGYSGGDSSDGGGGDGGGSGCGGGGCGG